MTTVPGTSPTNSDDWAVRAGTEQDYPEMARIFCEALLMDRAEFLEHMLEYPVVEYDRGLVAVDDHRVIGSAQAFSFDFTLPAGPRPVAGITAVGVWPTHRRRGVLTALMRRQLADIRDRGEKVAVLWASEGGIYERFGYGQGIRELRATIRRVDAILSPDVPRDPELTVELYEPLEAIEVLTSLHRDLAPTRVGQFTRSTRWWEHILHHKSGEGELPRVAVVYGPDGPQGYARYTAVSNWVGGGAHGRLQVNELYTATPRARVALYEHLFSRDLIGEITFSRLPLDDPLPLLLVDRNKLERRPYDSLWVRLVDLPGALADRPWATTVETVLEVSDHHAPWNAGRWKVITDTDGVRVEPTDAAPDIGLDTAQLGGAYLGQVPLHDHWEAGRLTEHTPGAVARMDQALYLPGAPFCGSNF